jgi:hypothetical protein
VSKHRQRRVMTGTGMTLGASLITGVTGAHAGGANFEVDRTDDTVVTACTGAANDCTLRGAVQNANADLDYDGITFDSTLTGSMITLSVADLDVTNPVYVDGPGANALTISGGDGQRIFDIDMTYEAESFSVSGLTLTQGNADDGGAIYNLDATLIVYDCTLTGNTATGDGGAVYDRGNDPIDLDPGAEGYLTRFVRTAIVNNDAGSDGGGVGGRYSAGYFYNSTVSGNTAVGQGGGVWSDLRSHLFDSTVSNNMAALGGGVHSVNEFIQVENTILANNTAATGPDAAGDVEADFSLIENTAGLMLSGANNITGQDPQLGALALNGGETLNRLPAATSPVVDKGLASGPARGGPTEEDQRESARPIDVPAIANAAGGDASDIGAVELTLAEAALPVNPVPPTTTQPPKKKKKKCKKKAKKKSAAAAKKCKKKKKK